MPPGRLRVHLGAAPGVGKTCAMLHEARRRAAADTDVVIGAVDDHGRTTVRAMAAGLEVIGSGAELGRTELDLDAVLRRRPAVVLVDDLARPNPPGSRHAARWQDVELLLAEGIDVISAVDVRSVASLAEVIEQLTGVRPSECVPDRLLERAELELIDTAPQTLRRRLAHGSICPPEEIDAALSSTFRPATLAALRELALLWLAGVVRRQTSEPTGPDRTGPDRTGPDQAPPSESPPPSAEVRERFLVALSGGPETEQVLHRAARMAARTPGADLRAVHVLPGRRLPSTARPEQDRLRELAESVGATYQQVIGDDVAVALLEVAAAEHATQLVVGGDAPSGRVRTWFGRRPGVARRLVARSSAVDVHVVTAASRRRVRAAPPAGAGLSATRRGAGFALAVLLPIGLTLALLPIGDQVGLAGDSLLLLLAVVVTALVGGLWPALLAAVVAFSLLNYSFIPPVHTFWVNEGRNVVTLVVFLLVAALVSGVVDRAAALAAQAARASATSRTLAAIADGVLRGEEALPTLLGQVRSVFGMTCVALLERVDDAETPAGTTTGTARWQVVGAVGTPPPPRPEAADVQVPAGPTLVLALRGHPLDASDRTVLRAFATQARSVLERDRLARAAQVAARLEATERLRDALLAAVGHDLRTPLASAKAAVTSLRSKDVTWAPAEREELLATAEESLDRLGALVADLLDLSRLRAGVLSVAQEVVWSDDLLATALEELGPEGAQVVLQLPEEPPAVLADPALLQRALVNVLSNALRFSPPGRAPTVSVSALGPRVEVRVIDRGPGIPSHDLARVFTPFQRLGDTDNGAGLGLGLALSRGLLEAMGGTLEPEDTPGGGLTMVLALPSADDLQEYRSQPGRREREVRVR